MGRKNKSDKYSNINLFECKFLGKGHNGIVYRLPDGKVIKICFVMKDFYGEAHILKKYGAANIFPNFMRLVETT